MGRVFWRHFLIGGVAGALSIAACGGAADDDAATTAPPGRTGEPTITTHAPRMEPPPERWVGIDGEGRLVVASSGAGEVERVLGAFDHPEDCPSGGEPVAGCRWVVDVAVGPDRRDVYYETCCEPAPGTIYRVPIGGGDPEMIVHGGHPAIDPSGQRLAIVELQWVTVHPLRPGGDGARFESRARQPAALHGMAWSPGGERLAFTVFEESGAPGHLHVLEVDRATSLDDARRLAADEPDRSWLLPAFRADGMLVVVEQDIVLPESPEGPARRLVVDPDSGEVGAETDLDESVLSQRYDPSGIHLISVMGDGSVVWSNTEGERAVLSDGGYLAAAW